MTREEAIQILSIWLVSAKGTATQRGYIEGWFDEDDDEAFRMAIEALSVQVTGKLKKPCNSLLTDDSEDAKEHKSKLDLISRQDAIDAVTKTQGLRADAFKALVALPSAEPKTGEWVKVVDEETPNVTKWHYECDQCGAGRYENGQRYCSNCGSYNGGEEE